MICSTCRAVLTEAAEWEPLYSDDCYSGRFPHHVTLQSLKTSLDEKCFVCVSFWSKLAAVEQQTLMGTSASLTWDGDGSDPLSSAGLTFISITGNPEDSFEVTIILGSEGLDRADGRNDYGVFRLTQAINDEEIAKINHLKSIKLSKSTRSQETLSLARKWIIDCRQNHPKCNSSEKTVCYPTRLLDSGALDSRSESTVSLVETKDTQLNGPYMTLSHSWGEGVSYTLNKASHHKLRGKFPRDDLPRLFQDAILVSRQMGVRYVWIDALCIFQDKDDLSDWNKEASQMHEIYSNSICNIVAGETPDSSQSIFNSRDPSMIMSPFTTITIKGKKRPPGSCEEFTAQYIISDTTFWGQVEDARINTRGWVLQERFMSPRGLHFGSEQLFWECREKVAAEVSPDGIYMDTSNTPFKSHYVEMQGRKAGRNPKFGELGDASWKEVGYTFWSTLITKYSACALRYPTDKLVAFSAITKQIATVYEDQYVAGISRRSFRTQLLWYVDSEESSETSRYNIYVAPTWSWASVNGKINTIEFTKADFRFEIRSCDLDYVTEDQTGAVRSAVLRLRGTLKRLKLLRLPTTDGIEKKWDVIVDGFQIDKEEEVDPWRVFLDVPQDNFEAENRNGTLCYMAASEHRDTYGRSLIGFLLKSIDFREGTFERLGLIWLVGGSRRANKNVLTSKAPRRGTLPCVQFKNGYHTIDVL